MITAILNVYRRPELLAKQVEILRGQSVPPDHIWIWQNKAPEEIHLHVPRGLIHVQSNHNFLYHGRFAFALLAQRHSEYAAIFDDDIMPGRRWLENCLLAWRTSLASMSLRGIASCRMNLRVRRDLGLVGGIRMRKSRKWIMAGIAGS